ncbi:hypothetical protein CTEN210_13479 [Chaetoceros tenuissimus]|uniref:F-box domain-containing protein n=1 Tax=Chaetoceros tenuissimus TaxID=426638 RepID=A0AAD3HBG8_9STRA|nr:hypothetical protein CTEN210_13479 [Chaetoceros tenuissimus]
MTSRKDHENEAPTRKRARVEDHYCKKRLEQLTHKIQDLAESFPELKYIIDISNLSKIVEPAVIKYKHEVDAKKNEKNSLIYRMPDELLKSCFSYVGKGSFLLVAPVSKKFHHMYKTLFKGDYDRFNKASKWHTFYSTAATDLSTAKYCLDVVGCKETREYYKRDIMAKIFVQAAYKGQIDIIKLADHLDFSYFWNKEFDSILRLLRRPIEKIAELGHLNVLKFLHENFNMHFALPMASRGAAFGGQIHILKWLKENKILYDLKQHVQRDTLCYSALAGGQLETLKWLRKEGFNLSERVIIHESPFEIGNMATAIKTGNIELIKYCKDLGFNFEIQSHYIDERDDCLAIMTGNIDLIRYCSEIGCEFTERIWEFAYEHVTVEILEFLRSKSLPWSSKIINRAAEFNQFDVLKYAHENGCEWSKEAWQRCMKQKPCINWDIVHYLHEKKCPWEPDLDLQEIKGAEDRLRVLQFIFSKKLLLDENVLIQCLKKGWPKETKLIIENTTYKVMLGSLKYVMETYNCNLETIQYLHSIDHPFGKRFLRKISYLDIPDQEKILVWALENGCQVKDTEELYRVVKNVQFYKKEWLGLLLSRKKFSGLDQIVERIIRNQLYREGFGLEQFQLFLNHGCSMSPSLVKTIYKYWLLDSTNKSLNEIVAFISSSNHSQPSIDELYSCFELGFSSTDSDEECNEEDGNDEDDYNSTSLPIYDELYDSGNDDDDTDSASNWYEVI